MRHLGTRQIETKRLILRRFTVEDAEAMYRNWAGDPEVTKFLMWAPHGSVEDTRLILETWVIAYEKEDKYEWCIALKDSNEPVGSIGVVSCNEKTRAMEVGYCIGREYWHRGLMSEALAAVMQYLLTEVGAERIESRHDPRNPHSGAVMRKCGMKYEGTRIRADWNNSGICDCALYGYVKEPGVALPGADGPTGAGAREQNGPTGEEKPGENSASGGSVWTAGDVPEGGLPGADGPTEADLSGAGSPSGGSGKRPRHVISDETIEYVGILAKLELSEEESAQAKKDMGEMLDYIDKLNELDTKGVEPMSHIFPMCNVFREDVVENGDGSADTLCNAPEEKDGGFKVPRTIG